KRLGRDPRQARQRALETVGERTASKPSFMKRDDVLRCAIVAGAVLGLAGCGSSPIASLPRQAAAPAAPALTGVVAPAKRGKIKLFIDVYADPAPAGITAGPDGALWFSDPGNDTI